MIKAIAVNGTSKTAQRKTVLPTSRGKPARESQLNGCFTRRVGPCADLGRAELHPAGPSPQNGRSWAGASRRGGDVRRLPFTRQGSAHVWNSGAPWCSTGRALQDQAANAVHYHGHWHKEGKGSPASESHLPSSVLLFLIETCTLHNSVDVFFSLSAARHSIEFAQGGTNKLPLQT